MISSPDKKTDAHRGRWLCWCMAAAILTVALGWRLMGITATELWRDEAISLLHAETGWRDLLFKLPWVEDTPPLNFIVFKIWSLLFDGLTGMRLLPVLVGVAVVAVLMAAARRIQPGGWWSVGLLAALAPLSLHFSQELRVYSLLMLVTAVCFWAAMDVAAGRRSAGNVILLVASASAATHCHAVGLFVFPAVAVYSLCRGGWVAFRPLLRWYALPVWLLLIAPMLWFSLRWARFHQEVGDWWIAPLSLSSLRWYAGRFLGLGLVDSWTALSRMGRMWSGFLLERAVLVAAAVLLSTGIADRRTRRTVLSLLAAAATFVSLLVISSIVGLPNVIERTLLPAHIPLLLALGIAATAGWTALTKIAARASLLVLTAIMALGWAWLIASGEPRRDSSTEAFVWLRDRVGPGDLVLSLPDWFEDLAVYHLRDRLPGDAFISPSSRVYDGMPPRHQMVPRIPEPDWPQRLREALDRGSGRVWVLRYRGFSPAAEKAALAGLTPIASYSIPVDFGVVFVGYSRP